MNIYDINVKNIDGKEISMSKYKGKTLLIVNVASNCGFTPQYEGLQELYETYKDKDFMVLGFPSNEFSNQEPGDEEEIKSFCSLTYNVKFDMFSKVEVNGENESLLFKYLKEQQSGLFGSEKIKWNFTKFLINKDGKVINRYAPITKPLSLKKDIEKLLTTFE
ncbi:MAG: glutathione peroxidase [Halarcobacter sp.]